MFAYLFSILFISLLFSCATFSSYKPGSSNPVKSDFTVLSEVDMEFSSSVLFYTFSWGDNDLKVIEKLKKKYKADDIININVAEQDSVIIYGLYMERKYRLKGTAIKYNN